MINPIRTDALDFDVQPGCVTVTHPPSDTLTMTADEAVRIGEKLFDAAAQAEGERRFQEDVEKRLRKAGGVRRSLVVIPAFAGMTR